MESSAGYSAPSSPDLKPDFASSFSHAARQFKNYFGNLLLVTLAYLVIVFVIQLPVLIPAFSGQPYNMVDNPGLRILYSLVVALISAIMFYGYILATTKAARGETPAIVDLFRPFTRFFPVVFSGILLYLIICLGFLLLIIPGIFFMCRLIFVPYLVVDRKAGVFEAIAGSWRLTRGHFWTVFLLGLVMTAIEGVIFGIGSAICIPFMFVNGFTAGSMPNMWPFMIVMCVVSIPLMIYFGLIWGSLFNAVQFEKADKNPLNPVSPTPPPASPIIS